jgi:hypothetical protein
LKGIEADYLLETPIDPGEAAQIMGHTLNVDGGFRAAGLMFGPDKAAPSR